VTSAADPGKQAYSPHVTQNLPTHVYFCDMHLHTAASFDAGATGGSPPPSGPVAAELLVGRDPFV
jgi:hypothetical protein